MRRHFVSPGASEHLKPSRTPIAVDTTPARAKPTAGRAATGPMLLRVHGLTELTYPVLARSREPRTPLELLHWEAAVLTSPPHVLPPELTPRGSAAPLRVLVSYSHDSEDHSKQVLQLVNALRAEGIDAVCDQHHPWPADGWASWMFREFSRASAVILVCTAEYKRRFQLETPVTVGRGVAFEGQMIRRQWYLQRSAQPSSAPDPRRFKRLFPLGLGTIDPEHVPVELGDLPHFSWGAHPAALLAALRGEPSPPQREDRPPPLPPP